MVARVTSGQVPPEKLDEFARWWQGTVGGLKRQVEGFNVAYLLADRQSGTGQAVSLWDSQDAMESAMARVNEAMQQAGEYFTTHPHVEVLEVVAQV